MSPRQKAEVVKLVKNDDPEAVTLAIGDGANDVSMIQEPFLCCALLSSRIRLTSLADIKSAEPLSMRDYT
mgnify:CR=1 FL=1